MLITSAVFDEFVRRNLNSTKNRMSGTATPDWIIYMDDMLESTLDGSMDQTPTNTQVDYTKCAQIFDFEITQAQMTQETTTGNLFSRGTFEGAPVLIQMLGGSYIPKLETRLSLGQTVSEIHVIQLAQNSGSDFYQVFSFQECTLQVLKQIRDEFFFSFRPKIQWHLFKGVDQDTKQRGGVVSSYDFEKGKPAELQNL